MFWNFVRSEIYRATRMKSLYILPAILFIVVLISGFMMLKVDLFAAIGMDREQYDKITAEGAGAEGLQDSFMTGFNAGLDASTKALEGEGEDEVVEEESEPVNIFGEGVLYHDDVPLLFNNIIAGLDTILFLAIFAGLFIGDGYSTGYGKNIVIANKHRTTMFAAKLTVLGIYTFLIQLVTWIFTIVIAALWAESVKLNIDASFIKYFIYTCFMTFVFVVLVAVITVLTRSKAAGITLGVILSAGMFTMIISLATLFVKNNMDVPEDFDIAKYTITQNIATLTLDSSGSDVVRGLLCCTIYGAMLIVAGVLLNKKRDIN